jgi:ParB family chromosome partitioning protein
MKIDLKQIKPATVRVRKSWSPKGIEELAFSIQEQGLVVPPKVRPNGKGYDVVYGHRRIEAARKVGLKEIECVVEGMDDDKTLIQALTENVVREDMNDADKGDALRLIKGQTGKSWAQVASMFGWGERRAKEIADVRPEEAKVIRGSATPLGSHAVRLARVAGDQTVAVLKKATSEGLTERQTERVAKSVAAAKSPEMKEHLIKTPFSTQLHDPVNVKQAPRLPTHKAIIKRDWSQSPEVVHIIDHLNRLLERYDQWRDTADAGKFSPEGARFVAKRMREAARKMLTLADYIERSTK